MTTKQAEAAFLASYNIHDYDLPLTSVDIVIFTVREQALEVLLVKRKEHPSQGKWALPGGFIDLKTDRSLDDTAFRKLKEKTGAQAPYLEQVITVGNGKRDPRGWSVTVVYMALVAQESLKMEVDNENVRWASVEDPALKLAFDHNAILRSCLERLRNKVLYTSLPVKLLPESFTLTELQKTFETILNTSLQKKAFRRRILDSGILEETGDMQVGKMRPAILYRVKPEGEHHQFDYNIQGPRKEERLSNE